jgi:hypothetical protein
MMDPTALYHMVVSSSRSDATRLLSVEAERNAAEPLLRKGIIHHQVSLSAPAAG